MELGTVMAELGNERDGEERRVTLQIRKLCAVLRFEVLEKKEKIIK